MTELQLRELRKLEIATFERDGVMFVVKYHGRGAYSLSASNNHVRSRWGQLAEITADLRHCLTTGVLPRPSGERW